jgi:hypothetical protein
MREADALSRFADIDPMLADLVVMEASKRNMSVLELRLKKRDNWRTAPKRRLIARKARMMGFSFPQIGKALNRDHTIIIGYCRDLPADCGAKPEPALEREILDYCRTRGVALSRFGTEALGYRTFMTPARRGKAWRKETALKVRRYLDEAYEAERQEGLPL